MGHAALLTWICVLVAQRSIATSGSDKCEMIFPLTENFFLVDLVGLYQKYPNNSNITTNGVNDSIMEVEYRVVETEVWGGDITINFDLQKKSLRSSPNKDGKNYTHLGLRFRNVREQTNPYRAHVRFIITDVSGCNTEVCPQLSGENYFSFHYILDDKDATNWTQLMVPLKGSEDPSDPFWLPGWYGELGNRQLDASNMSEVALQFSIDSQDSIGSSSEGEIWIGDLGFYNCRQDDLNDTVVEEPEAECLWVPDLTITVPKEREGAAIKFANVDDPQKCCDIVSANTDEFRFIQKDSSGSCYSISELKAEWIQTVFDEKESDFSGWTLSRQTVACGQKGVCSCSKEKAMIDCSQRNLTVVPIVTKADQAWASLLNLSHNSIAIVTNELLGGNWANLTTLDLTSNAAFIFLSPRVNEALPNLEALLLSPSQEPNRGRIRLSAQSRAMFTQTAHLMTTPSISPGKVWRR